MLHKRSWLSALRTTITKGDHDDNGGAGAPGSPLLQEFLVEIHATQSVDFASMAVCLVDKATSPDEFTRMTAIKWLKVGLL